MENNSRKPGKRTEEPMIVKRIEKSHNGIETLALARCAVAYVLKGRQYIYDGDRRRAVGRGEVVYFGIGRHYIESFPEGNQPFEQLFFYYTPQDLGRVLRHLSVTYHTVITNTHRCERCERGGYVVGEAPPTIRSFFQNTNIYLREHEMERDETAEGIKLTELVYLLCTEAEGCLKSRLLHSIDATNEHFKQVIYDHLFAPISIEELASKTNRSLTSFKKEFRRHFNTPPHKWFVQQRLIHSKLLLISTSKSIAEIGNECTFPNTSHFIKLFKRAYHTTPASYRSNVVQRTEDEHLTSLAG